MRPYYEDPLVTLYNGDCREVLPTLPVGSIDMLTTDPPYGLGVPYGERGRRRRTIIGDSDTELLAWVAGQTQVLAADAWSAIFCGWNGLADVTEAMTGAGLTIKTVIVWDKLRPGQGYGVRDQHEFIALGRRGNPPRPWSGGNVWRMAPVYNPDHPNEKPLGLLRILLGRLADRPCVVLDPFAGSGPTLVAAKALGHRSIGIEIEERYCEVAANRLRQEVLGLEVA